LITRLILWRVKQQKPQNRMQEEMFIAVKKVLPLQAKILYGFSSTGFYLINSIITAWLFYYYTTPQGPGARPMLAPALLGVIVFSGRVVDAVADPIVARFSDNFDSRYGRRIPFMAGSGIFLVAVFIALFYPPVFGEQSIWNGIYLAVLLALYFALFTAYVCPYLALLPELARTTRDRVDLATIKAVFSALGTGGALILGGVLINRLGYHGMVWVVGLLALFFLYLPVTLREKDYVEGTPADLGLFEAIKTTLKNRPFVLYMAGFFSFWFGGSIVMESAPFYITVLLGRDEATTALFFGVAFASAALSFPVVNLLAKKIGLKKMMMLSMLVLTLTLPMLYFIGRPVLGLEPLVFALICIAVAGFPIASLFIIPDAIVASVTDLEKKLSGQCRQAMYYGTQGLIMKFALGTSTVIMGFLFQVFGQTAEQSLGVQLTGPSAAVFTLIGLLIFSRFPEKEVLAATNGRKPGELMENRGEPASCASIKPE
jgi:glycoside/pentoside/hexuronide:cation symporter, GPH family